MFSADARVQRKAAQLWFRFSNYSSVNDHILGTGAVLAREISPDHFTFSFTNNWGGKGVGTVTANGRGIRVTIERAAGERDEHNTEINYGEFDLRPAPCGGAR